MKGGQVRYSKEELAWIEEHREHTRRNLHKLFVMFFNRPDVTLDNIKALCTRKGWRTGRTGCFTKGSIPPNKGRKGYCAPGSEKGWFKKGQKGTNYKGPGHEYPSKGDYIMLIVAETNPYTGADTRPVLKHKYLWEQKNGPLPADHCLKCLDGDRQNCDPDNWVAVPRAILPRLAGRWGQAFDDAPPELKPSLLATALLEHAARQARKSASVDPRTARIAVRSAARRQPTAEAAGPPAARRRRARTP